MTESELEWETEDEGTGEVERTIVLASPDDDAETNEAEKNVKAKSGGTIEQQQQEEEEGVGHDDTIDLASTDDD